MLGSVETISLHFLTRSLTEMLNSLHDRVLSPLVACVLGQNPGAMTLQGTNTYLVGTGPARILIDTGEGKPGYLKSLVEMMQNLGASRLSDVILSHWHPDHTGLHFYFVALVVYHSCFSFLSAPAMPRENNINNNNNNG